MALLLVHDIQILATKNSGVTKDGNEPSTQDGQVSFPKHNLVSIR